MSEGASEGPQKQSPRERAIQYILERDAKRSQKIKLGGFEGRKTNDSEIEIAAATAYERVVEKLGEGGTKQAMEALRPAMYDAARLYRFGAKYADMLVTGALLVAPSLVPGLGKRLDKISGLDAAKTAATTSLAREPRLRTLGIPLPIKEDFGIISAHAKRAGILGVGVAGMMTFRPAEWAAKTLADVGGVAAVGGIDLINKITNNIIDVKPTVPKSA